MKFSIITAVLNNKSGLIRALESINNQSYANIEHIIIDGGSNDGTIEYFKDRKLPHTKFFSSPDKGIYDAINKGIKVSTGDIIGLLHSDDELADKDTIKKIAELFDRSKADSVYSDLVYVDKNNSTIIRNWVSGEFIPGRIKRGWMPPHPTLYIKRSIFDRFGFYDITYKIAADYDIILRLFYKHKISTAYLPSITYHMSLGGASNKNLKNIIRKSSEDLKAMRSNELQFPLFTLICKNISKLPQFF